VARPLLETVKRWIDIASKTKD